MKKELRQRVYYKYFGHCAYCGEKISMKDMQVDHVIPERLGGLTEMKNLKPACKLCNHYKRATNLETWRNEFLGKIIDRLRKIYIFRVAEKYGMVEVKEWNKKFYFESFEK